MSARPSWFLFLSTPVLFLVLLLNDEGWRCLAQKRVFQFNPFCDIFNSNNKSSNKSRCCHSSIFYTFTGCPKSKIYLFYEITPLFFKFWMPKKTLCIIMKLV